MNIPEAANQESVRRMTATEVQIEEDLRRLRELGATAPAPQKDPYEDIFAKMFPDISAMMKPSPPPLPDGKFEVNVKLAAPKQWRWDVRSWRGDSQHGFNRFRWRAVRSAERWAKRRARWYRQTDAESGKSYTFDPTRAYGGPL